MRAFLMLATKRREYHKVLDRSLWMLIAFLFSGSLTRADPTGTASLWSGTMNHTTCPCHSGKPYGRCCKPFLTGAAKPRTVTQLMRSRYSAFAMGECGDYLFDTWHPENRGVLTAEDLSEPGVEWAHLRIVDSDQKADTGHVEFIATFLQEDGSEGTHHEKSFFVREKGQWLYHSGDVTTTG